MKGFLIDPYKRIARVVDFNDDLHEYYRMLHCELIDIVVRKIGGIPYNIVCDDEGAYRQDVRVSAMDDIGSSMLVGAILVAGMDDGEGNLLGLEAEDVMNIRRHMCHYASVKHPEGWDILTDLEY